MLGYKFIEQHFHGAFGVNFSNCSVDDVVFVSKKMKEIGIYGFFPTLVTDTVENIKCQIDVIKQASEFQSDDAAKILGIHLEGIFINPLKKGIHDEKLFMAPTIDNYRLIEDDFIKIVTLAPESDKDRTLINYLNNKGVKVQAGHCTESDLSGCSGITHLFNAMNGIHHRVSSTALSALLDDSVYVEVIADGVHLSDDILKLIFKTKPLDKIILISDCLPCAGIGVNDGETYTFNFAGEKIYFDGVKAVSEAGTLAGSSMLLPDIIKRLIINGFINDDEAFVLAKNVFKYHNIKV